VFTCFLMKFPQRSFSFNPVFFFPMHESPLYRAPLPRTSPRRSSLSCVLDPVWKPTPLFLRFRWLFANDLCGRQGEGGTASTTEAPLFFIPSIIIANDIFSPLFSLPVLFSLGSLFPVAKVREHSSTPPKFALFLYAFLPVTKPDEYQSF